ncbi:Morn repeat incomplete domain containing protein [Pandoravirus quercus]|uniref:Morn repeat incomplete domain containing protein n=1 Tax=Pandoravirus quercus TaxID=2107709 RepID=A0A2U7U841_9VIRU|nr:Morn repeat incomplete domain containing protein [Pandoravirus quercus]AVK74590.1 Morn repeat incomplete domain containing protein [Pandoravirus quercus]
MAVNGSSLAGPSCGLVDMPHEVVWRVVGALLGDATLGINDAASLAATCRTMAATLVDDDAMWRVLVRRHFGRAWADLHTMPDEFGVRWMRVYARVSRTATCAANEAATGYIDGPTYKTSCEGLLVSGDVVCGRLVMGRLNGYGVVCAAQHEPGRLFAQSTNPRPLVCQPAVFMEGHFTDDLLDGRGILRRGEWRVDRSSRLMAAALTTRGFSVTCRCRPCRQRNRPQRRRADHPCACEHAAQRCQQCRFSDDCRCGAREDPCASCAQRLRVCAIGRFLACLETFDGHWVRGVPHGHAVARFECGTTYEGPWSRGLPHGHGLINGIHARQWFHGVLLPRGRLVYGHVVCTTATVAVVYEGDVKPRALTAETALVADMPPVLSEGGGDDDNNDSLAIINYPYRQYARHGHGQMCYADGSVFEGEWVEDMRHHGTLTRSDGTVLNGTWHATGGFGTIRWPDGRCDSQCAWDASGRHCSSRDPPA